MAMKVPQELKQRPLPGTCYCIAFPAWPLPTNIAANSDNGNIYDREEPDEEFSVTEYISSCYSHADAECFEEEWEECDEEGDDEDRVSLPETDYPGEVPSMFQRWKDTCLALMSIVHPKVGRLLRLVGRRLWPGPVPRDLKRTESESENVRNQALNSERQLLNIQSPPPVGVDCGTRTVKSIGVPSLSWTPSKGKVSPPPIRPFDKAIKTERSNPVDIVITATRVMLEPDYSKLARIEKPTARDRIPEMSFRFANEFEIGIGWVWDGRAWKRLV